MAEIGLSGLPLDYPHSGTAVYARNLVPLLAAAAPDLDFRLFLRWADHAEDGIECQTLRTPFARLNRGKGFGARLDKLAWEVGSYPIASAIRGEVLLHSLYFAAPVIAAAPVLVSVHDLIPLVVPGYHRGRQAAMYSRFMAWTVKRAAAIVTVSHHSKFDIVRILGVPEERVFVTHEAVDERFCRGPIPGESEMLRARYDLPERFVLYTGGAERRKNLETLVRAWARVSGAMRDQNVRLVIVADFPTPDHLYPDIPGLVRELDMERDVIFVRQVAEEDKPALYRAALVFCFPSRYEGFGFTPLEALASGIAVIASDATSIPEVVGDAARLLPPNDVVAWADTIVELVESDAERATLGSRGIEQASKFSWQRTAEQTVEVYRWVLGR